MYIMKHTISFPGLLLLLSLLVFTHHHLSIDAAVVALHPHSLHEPEKLKISVIGKVVQSSKIGKVVQSSKMEGDDLLNNLMGVEECDENGDDEECLKRRLMDEAHLDYIYTQHHKP